ncbi:MAG: ATP-dependent 6-phosphofructokinase [Deltaproteobacteria bacterium]|nr:ATP-dependent 6-phosphofructokinase [Deltaproteobacteria bacterium]
MKIGILTGGGDCPGLNAVIRGVVKTASIKYKWEVIGIESGFEGLILEGHTRDLTPWRVRGILPIGGTILWSSNRGDPFNYPVEENGSIVKKDLSARAMEKFKKLGLDALIVVGGDGTMTIANKFYKMGMSVVGVPKTIDNDLMATDLTFGFSTAVQTATEALDKLHTTAASHKRVIVVELMGRYAGWIALYSGIAGGADCILIPEIHFDIEKVCKHINDRVKHGACFSIIVVSEGAKPIGGDVTLLRADKNDGVERLGGIGEKVGKWIEEMVDIDVRVTVLGHIQRGGSPNSFDRILSTRFGSEAVELIKHEKFGRMVCLKGQEIESVALDDAIARQKVVAPNSSLVKVAEAIGICMGR